MPLAALSSSPRALRALPTSTPGLLKKRRHAVIRVPSSCSPRPQSMRELNLQATTPTPDAPQLDRWPRRVLASAGLSVAVRVRRPPGGQSGIAGRGSATGRVCCSRGVRLLPSLNSGSERPRGRETPHGGVVSLPVPLGRSGRNGWAMPLANSQPGVAHLGRGYAGITTSKQTARRSRPSGRATSPSPSPVPCPGRRPCHQPRATAAMPLNQPASQPPLRPPPGPRAARGTPCDPTWLSLCLHPP